MTVSPDGASFTKEFPPNRIAAAMILGDHFDKDDLTNLVDSLKKCEIDKLFIAFNGKSRRTHQWLWNYLSEIELRFVVQKFAWEEDFAKARNQSFDMIPKEEFDWILWIDSDDVLIAEKPIKEVLAELDPYTQGVYLRYDYAVDPKSGAVAVQQWRERILSTKATWQWIYPIHEVVFSPSNTQFARKEEVYIKHNRKVGEKDEIARARNRKIISKALRDNPQHARMQFYFANEVMAEADGETNPSERSRLAEAAILAFRRFLSSEGVNVEDLYMASTRIGELYLMKGEQAPAIDAFLSSLKIIPDWPDAYIGIARAAMELEDWPRTKAFCNIALSLAKPITPGIITPLTYSYTPLLLRGMAHQGMGKFAEALEDYEAAFEIYQPQNEMLTDRIAYIKKQLAVTSKDMDLRKSLRGKRPEKSIAFVTAPLVEPWHPELEKESGAGGAETCIMRLAPRFAADGYRVAVFGTPGAENRGVDNHGVEYWDSNEFLPNEQFSVVVASRVPEVFEAEVNAKLKLLWMHDVNVGPKLGAFFERIDSVIGLTDWHVNHMAKLYQQPLSKFSVVPNGIELGLYDWSLKKEPTDELRFIWSSSPDRGLMTMVALWPHIKQMYPTSRLDIFYGWNIINKLIQKHNAIGLKKLKETILSNIEAMGGEEFGIYQHGRVPQTELAQWQLDAHIWGYPTDFMETFCITAIEAQAAGAIPITSKLAALRETVANPDLLIEGWPLNSDYQKRWINLLESVVEGGDARQIELQNTGRSFAEQFSWDNVYNSWQNLLRRHDG